MANAHALEREYVRDVIDPADLQERSFFCCISISTSYGAGSDSDSFLDSPKAEWLMWNTRKDKDVLVHIFIRPW